MKNKDWTLGQKVVATDEQYICKASSVKRQRAALS